MELKMSEKEYRDIRLTFFSMMTEEVPELQLIENISVEPDIFREDESGVDYIIGRYMHQTEGLLTVACTKVGNKLSELKFSGEDRIWDGINKGGYSKYEIIKSPKQRGNLRPVSFIENRTEKIGYFHCFNSEGNYEEGVGTYGTVELEDGTVTQVDAYKIKFLDV